jgi:hypothetical protein
MSWNSNSSLFSNAKDVGENKLTSDFYFYDKIKYFYIISQDKIKLRYNLTAATKKFQNIEQNRTFLSKTLKSFSPGTVALPTGS